MLWEGCFQFFLLGATSQTERILIVLFAVALCWYGMHLNEKAQNDAVARGESPLEQHAVDTSNHPLFPILKRMLIIIGIVFTIFLNPCLGLPICVFGPIIAAKVFSPTK